MNKQRCDLCHRDTDTTYNGFHVQFATTDNRDAICDSVISFLGSVKFEVRTDIPLGEARICEKCILGSVFSKPYRLMHALKGRQIPEIQNKEKQ